MRHSILTLVKKNLVEELVISFFYLYSKSSLKLFHKYFNIEDSSILASTAQNVSFPVYLTQMKKKTVFLLIHSICIHLSKKKKKKNSDQIRRLYYSFCISQY